MQSSRPFYLDLGTVLACLLGITSTAHSADDNRLYQHAIPVRSLAVIVQSIRTITEAHDGTQTINIGSGFVIGRRFYTVHHNLAVTSADASRITYIAGVAVEPTFVQAAQDLAVFDLPESLCREYCNEFAVSEGLEIRPGQAVVWLRKFGDELTVKRATILNVSLLGESSDWSCSGNLIVEVDKPFVRGSSGGPVLDAETGNVVGIIQGTLVRDGIETGFFKPIDCVGEMAVTAAVALSAT